jgi:hypothetical protein
MKWYEKLTKEDLRGITWDYDNSETVGFYEGVDVRAHLWLIKGGLMDSAVVSRCNMAEGWIEVREYVDRPVLGEQMRHLEKFSGTLEILTSKGEVLVAFPVEGQ